MVHSQVRSLPSGESFLLNKQCLSSTEMMAVTRRFKRLSTRRISWGILIKETNRNVQWCIVVDSDMIYESLSA